MNPTGEPFDVPAYRICLDDGQIDAALAGIENVLRGGIFVLGPHTERFEQSFSKLVETEAVAVSTGTTALEIIYRAIDVRDRPVLVPVNTNFATARAVLAAGGRPVFYDGGLYPSVEDIERRLTRDTRALTVVHIGGHISPDMPRLAEIARDRGVALVEDAAHAHGSTLAGKPAGAWGDAAAFSFFPTKVITTFEGGAVVSADPAITKAARVYRNQGKDPATGLHVVDGNSWRMSEVGAVLGSVQLQRLDEDTARRQDVLELYRRELSHLESLRFPEVTAGSRLSGHKAIVLLSKGSQRSAVVGRLRRRGVAVAGAVYDVPLHRQPVFRGIAADSFPLAEEFCGAHLCLPIWTGMRECETHAVINAVKEAVR
ncbi:DegT/DnrJ/EryC1/StrS family aminotransferase [Nocardia beijingensis]|uniref:DegT/DnrJ/EryC1/StrS family aminotransferase n=1 Tax=Nocardia beijingensis TaxID=95162 RepID=UPI00344F7E28